MAKIEFSANPSCLPKRPRSSPPLGRDETRNSVDYISQLPDAIILHIFAFLTSEDAVRTSVLSKRWRSTWTANPHISFSMPARHHRHSNMMLERFMAFMDAVLLLCTAIKVKSFIFAVDRGLDSAIAPTIDRWLDFAVGHDLEELTLRKDNIYALSQFFFRCTTLVSSHLSRCRFSKIATVNWSSLKRLHIEDAELEDDTMMQVLRGSPALEFLHLDYCVGFHRIIVESRCLRELVIDCHGFHHAQVPILKISAPHLLKLRLLGDYCETDFEGELGEYKLDEASSLVEAELNFEIQIFENDKAKVCVDIVKGLLERPHHVTTLVIGSWCLQVLSIMEAREVFLPSLECRYLMFHVAVDHFGVHSIVKILESSPRLEKLFLQMTCTPGSNIR
ncbi:F-box/LRR-repeat protein 25-like [Rhodamnia argentea]|uniref:F-box/LRR-repeat protein 25-like n=1 Tax=Rhodamnia argentea TaxID=178133 RepID=A0ABM3H4E0_9MYRT|nr:F-box/LRR-repeat protein 25-like [Rhodamnia argentea]